MRARLQVLILLACSLLISCISDPMARPDPDSGKASVLLNINTPKPSTPSSRVQTESESAISEVRVLVFEESGGDYIFSYHIKGTEVSSSGAQTQFRAVLETSEAPVKLIILANTGDSFGANAPVQGETEAEVRAKMTYPFSAAGMQDNLPMYGEVSIPGGIDASQTYTLPVTVLRAIARVDVVKDMYENAPGFTLEEVYVFRANDRIQLIPDALVSDSQVKVSTPSIPQGTVALADAVVKKEEGGAESIIQLYIPESSEAVTNNEKIKEATTVIIGGRFEGGDNPVTYYRADFNSGVQGHPFGQVLRNYRYIFNIKSVTREGWPTPEEAAENLSSSIIVDIQPWEDFSSEMYLGDDRFGISSRSISLRYVSNRERQLDVESTFAYQIQWLKNGVPVGEATADYGHTISNEDFDAWIVRNEDDAEYVTHLRFRTLKNNNIGDIITDTLRVTAGPWKVDIKVSQDNSELYKGRIMNVLSVETVGNLGVDMVDPLASGLAMRKVLDIQFSPTGVIRIGGSSFTRIPNTAGYVGTSAQANLTVLNRIFGAQDVIYVPFNVGLSSEVADLLLAWLDGSKNRVLVIGTDSDETNKELRLKPKVSADGTWIYQNINTVSAEYIRAADSDNSGDFFNGPFGQVAAGAPFNRADDTAGYLISYPPAVTPLITADRTGYTTYMFFGVNTGSRIVYHGDAQLFQSGQMSNNNGTVNTDLDRLMANTWAWIVEQVIYGDS